MPTYSSCCPVCGKIYEYVSKISEREEKRPECCGKKTEGVILHAPMGYVDRPAAG